MRCRGLGYWSILLALGATIVAFDRAPAVAQSTAGVSIDADGVLRSKQFDDPGGQLRRERIAAAKATLNPKLASFSKLRKVSLNRLESVILKRQGVLTDEMRYLAGLQRVQYVFFYPDSKDIVLAGPAEGWANDPAGRVVGLTTGRPVVQLQDLAVALRMFPHTGQAVELIGCSIDPTPEGLAAMDHYLKTHRPDNVQTFVEGLRDSRGPQVIRIDGVPPKTHFAQVMVEADYRMKLIGIGLENPPVKMVTFIDKAKPGELGAGGLLRWYFVPDYQCVRTSSDGNAMELVGDGVKLVSENELVAEDGQRRAAAGRGSQASTAFINSFTKKYPELADRSPVYAELRNLIDLAVAAAFIQKQDYYGKAEWEMPFLGDEKAYPVETYNVPKTAASAVNAIRKGSTLMFPAAGGVQIQPAEALESKNLLADEKGKLEKTHQALKPDLAAGQWWWD